LLARPKDVFIPLAAIWQLVPFQWSDLKIPDSEYRSAVKVHRLMGRFVKKISDSKTEILGHPRKVLDEPELGILVWMADASDGGKISVSARHCISISYPSVSILPRKHALSLAKALRDQFRVPADWQVIQDPHVCDFKTEDSERIFFGFLGPGHKYSCPGKQFSVAFDSRTGRLASLTFDDSSTIEKAEVKLTVGQAVQFAKKYLNNDRSSDSCTKPYEAQIGLSYDFVGDGYVGAVRQCYRIPFTNRTVVSVDAENGKCISICCYK
jgi:hypothetical protein